MDLLMRRRALIGISTHINIAISYDDAPLFVQGVFNSGLCAKSEYITVEEAAKITQGQFNSISFPNDTSIPNDLTGFKYFTNITTTPPYWNDTVNKLNVTHLVLPSSFTEVSQYNRFTNKSGTISYYRIQSRLTNYRPFGSRNKVILIFDSKTPPVLTNCQMTFQEWGNALNFEIYVPDSAIQTYKDYFSSVPMFDGAYWDITPENLIARTFPASQYPYEWTGGFPLVTD